MISNSQRLLSVAAGLLLGIGLSTAAQADHGTEIYEGTCIACHGKNGKGEIPGTPDFTKADGPLAKSNEELRANIVNGYESPNSIMQMPPNGGNPDLSIGDVEHVIYYLHEKFGKH